MTFKNWTNCTWHLNWLRLLRPRSYSHIQITELILSLTKLLEGSEEELGTHPETPSRANVCDNLNLKQNQLSQ